MVWSLYMQYYYSLLSIENCSPAYATPRILEKAGLSLSDIDVFEFHEAFAVSLNLVKKAIKYSNTSFSC